MPKIENWSRFKARETGTRYRSKVYYWKNDKTDSNVMVRKIFINEDASRSDYPKLDGSAYIYTVSGPRGKIGQDYYKDKEDARKVAVSWMRNHARA